MSSSTYLPPSQQPLPSVAANGAAVSAWDVPQGGGAYLTVQYTLAQVAGAMVPYLTGIIVATPWQPAITAAGALPITAPIFYQVINNASAGSYALPTGTDDGQLVVVNNFGAGTATITGAIQGGSAVIASPGVVTLKWSAALSTWLLGS